MKVGYYYWHFKVAHCAHFLCSLLAPQFGSWTYDGNQIDLKHKNQVNTTSNMVEIGIDLREFYPSVEWDILGNMRWHGNNDL
jgi:hypothetical protein